MEAIVLDRPVVVLNAPTNLRALVEAGVALGVPVGADPTDVLQAALGGEASRAALRSARERYRPRLAFGTDGAATARILALVREVAGAASTPRAGDGHVRVMGP
jgi:hypothetical protein